MPNNQNILEKAQELVAKHGKKAIKVANRRIDNLPNKHSRDSDFAFRVLTQVEKILDS